MSMAVAEACIPPEWGELVIALVGLAGVAGILVLMFWLLTKILR